MVTESINNLVLDPIGANRALALKDQQEGLIREFDIDLVLKI